MSSVHFPNGNLDALVRQFGQSVASKDRFLSGLLVSPDCSFTKSLELSHVPSSFL